jgi:hypothetical protein
LPIAGSNGLPIFGYHLKPIRMKTIQDIKELLTKTEFSFLETVVGLYNPLDCVCYQYRLTPSEKGIVGSLVKKGLIYDSYAQMVDDEIHTQGNWYPSYQVLQAYGL